MPGQCVFNVKWLEDEQYEQWLTSVSDSWRQLAFDYMTVKLGRRWSLHHRRKHVTM